jgi:hypothetical protein
MQRKTTNFTNSGVSLSHRQSQLPRNQASNIDKSCAILILVKLVPSDQTSESVSRASPLLNGHRSATYRAVDNRSLRLRFNVHSVRNALLGPTTFALISAHIQMSGHLLALSAVKPLLDSTTANGTKVSMLRKRDMSVMVRYRTASASVGDVGVDSHAQTHWDDTSGQRLGGYVSSL